MLSAILKATFISGSLYVASTTLTPTPADAAMSKRKTPYICTFKTGEVRLVWEKAKKRNWEICEHRVAVKLHGFTTTRLTFGLSAAYDTQTKRYSRSAAGATSEFIKPGEHLLILDEMLNGRNLAYSLSTNSFRFVNLINLKKKLISQVEYKNIKNNYSANQIFMSVKAADFFADESLTKKGEIGSGRIFIWRDDIYDKFGSAYVKVECIQPTKCSGKIGWIPKTSLSEIKQVAWPTIPFPSTYQYPTHNLIKQCNIKSKITRSAEIKSVISAKVPFANLVGAELSASLEAALKNNQEDTYEKDIKIERTIFTIFKFRLPFWYESKRWIPKKVRVLIVDKLTQKCNTEKPNTHFILRTNDGGFQITNPHANAEITSSVVYTRFVAQAKSYLKGMIKEWELNHIASALSAQRR